MKYLLTLFTQIILVTFISTGCAPPSKDLTIKAYREISCYLSIGSPKKLWSILSSDSKRDLNQRLGRGLDHQEVPESLGLELDWAFESPFAGHATLYSDERMKESVDQKLIHTIYASQSWIIPVVLEKGTWRVHLLGARLLSPNYIAH